MSRAAERHPLRETHKSISFGQSPNLTLEQVMWTGSTPISLDVLEHYCEDGGWPNAKRYHPECRGTHNQPERKEGLSKGFHSKEAPWLTQHTNLGFCTWNWRFPDISMALARHQGKILVEFSSKQRAFWKACLSLPGHKNTSCKTRGGHWSGKKGKKKKSLKGQEKPSSHKTTEYSTRVSQLSSVSYDV